ncbi:hypothetical protein FB107DRAFT_279095 [Schizophyllum commune]
MKTAGRTRGTSKLYNPGQLAMNAAEQHAGCVEPSKEAYASTDCFGLVLARIDDENANCNSLPETAYSLKSYGPGCCGAALYAEANTCTGSSELVSAGANDGECISYPNGIKQYVGGCC